MTVWGVVSESGSDNVKHNDVVLTHATALSACATVLVLFGLL